MAAAVAAGLRVARRVVTVAGPRGAQVRSGPGAARASGGGGSGVAACLPGFSRRAHPCGLAGLEPEAQAPGLCGEV